MTELFFVIKFPVNASGLDIRQTARHGSMAPLSETLGAGEVMREFHLVHNGKVIEIIPIPIKSPEDESKLFKITSREEIG